MSSISSKYVIPILALTGLIGAQASKESQNQDSLSLKGETYSLKSNLQVSVVGSTRSIQWLEGVSVPTLAIHSVEEKSGANRDHWKFISFGSNHQEINTSTPWYQSKQNKESNTSGMLQFSNESIIVASKAGDISPNYIHTEVTENSSSKYNLFKINIKDGTSTAFGSTSAQSIFIVTNGSAPGAYALEVNTSNNGIIKFSLCSFDKSSFPPQISLSDSFVPTLPTPKNDIDLFGLPNQSTHNTLNWNLSGKHPQTFNKIPYSSGDYSFLSIPLDGPLDESSALVKGINSNIQPGNVISPSDFGISHRSAWDKLWESERGLGFSFSNDSSVLSSPNTIRFAARLPHSVEIYTFTNGKDQK